MEVRFTFGEKGAALGLVKLRASLTHCIQRNTGGYTHATEQHSWNFSDKPEWFNGT